MTVSLVGEQDGEDGGGGAIVGCASCLPRGRVLLQVNPSRARALLDKRLCEEGGETANRSNL